MSREGILTPRAVLTVLPAHSIRLPASSYIPYVHSTRPTASFHSLLPLARSFRSITFRSYHSPLGTYRHSFPHYAPRATFAHSLLGPTLHPLLHSTSFRSLAQSSCCLRPLSHSLNYSPLWLGPRATPSPRVPFLPRARSFTLWAQCTHPAGRYSPIYNSSSPTTIG